MAISPSRCAIRFSASRKHCASSRLSRLLTSHLMIAPISTGGTKSPVRLDGPISLVSQPIPYNSILVIVSCSVAMVFTITSPTGRSKRSCEPQVLLALQTWCVLPISALSRETHYVRNQMISAPLLRGMPLLSTPLHRVPPPCSCSHDASLLGLPGGKLVSVLETLAQCGMTRGMSGALCCGGNQQPRVCQACHGILERLNLAGRL